MCNIWLWITWPWSVLGISFPFQGYIQSLKGHHSPQQLINVSPPLFKPERKPHKPTEQARIDRLPLPVAIIFTTLLPDGASQHWHTKQTHAPFFLMLTDGPWQDAWYHMERGCTNYRGRLTDRIQAGSKERRRYVQTRTDMIRSHPEEVKTTVTPPDYSWIPVLCSFVSGLFQLLFKEFHHLERQSKALLYVHFKTRQFKVA